jgi:hypothetical protein
VKGPCKHGNELSGSIKGRKGSGPWTVGISGK